VDHGTADTRWTLARIGLAAGAFVCAVSFSLFIHTISQLTSPLICAVFIAAGVVARRRAATEDGRALAVGVIAGGAIAAIASLILVATGH
jgi:hypothetical protein